MPLPPAPGRPPTATLGSRRAATGERSLCTQSVKRGDEGGTAEQGGEDGRQALKMGRGGGGGRVRAACSSECSRAHLAGWGPGRQARGSGGGVGSASSVQLAPLAVSPHGIVSLGTAPRLIPSLLLDHCGDLPLAACTVTTAITQLELSGASPTLARLAHGWAVRRRSMFPRVTRLGHRNIHL